MRITALVLFSTVLFAQQDTYPKTVKLHGLVQRVEEGRTSVVEDCWIEILGMGSDIFTTSDSSGYFEVMVPISRDFNNFNISIILQFTKLTLSGQVLTARREISPRKIQKDYYDLGTVYLELPKTPAKPAPTVWDMLEDSLVYMHRKTSRLQRDLEQLNLQLASFTRQNENYRSQIKSLEKTSNDYYAEITELQARNQEYDQQLSAFMARFEKFKNSLDLFDNFFASAYLDVIDLRDSVLVLMSNAANRNPEQMDRYRQRAGLRNLLIFRQDLFAKHAGLDQNSNDRYLRNSSIRDSLTIRQDKLFLVSPPAKDITARYQELFSQRAQTIAQQDSIVLTRLIHYSKYEYHEVVPGDHLWKIATHHPRYRNPYAWRILYLFNKDQIANPDSIYPGQILKIPIAD